jgi:hypothetical protein
VLTLHVGYLFETGYYKEPESSPSRDLPRIEYMKKSKYISEDERGGFKVAKVNLPLSEGRLRLFLEGKKDWLEEGLFVQVKKKIKEKDCRRRFFHGLRMRCTTKLCATIWRNPGAVELLRCCANASMGEWCSHAPTKFCGAQSSLCRAICTPSLTTTKCGHHWRTRCEKHAKYRSHPNQLKPNG